MTRPLRVLHLEDSLRDAETVRHKLDAQGVVCDIILANSEASCEAALAQEPFDLILSDCRLPGYDGITALKRAQETQPDVPVILISGTVGEEEAVRCLHIGATDYLLRQRLDRLGPAVPPDNAPKMTEDFFQLIHPDDRRAVAASIEQAIAGERDFVVEFRAIWPDASANRVHGRAQASYDADGKPVRRSA